VVVDVAEWRVVGDYLHSVIAVSRDASTAKVVGSGNVSLCVPSHEGYDGWALSPLPSDRPSHGLRSLQDVLRFYADKFAGIMGYLTQMETAYVSPAPRDDRRELPAPNPLADENLLRLHERIERARSLANEIELSGTAGVFVRLLTAIGDPPHPRRDLIENYASNIAHLLGEARARLQEELGTHLFYQVAEQKRRYILTVNLFGERVAKRFRSATAEIRDASNAYAFR
jgi:hypothetical protein